MSETALEITTGQELLRFDLGTVEIGHRNYTVLTGYEGTGLCFWCGGELKGKLKRYCYGHMKLYYRHFEWGSARNWCCERQEGVCANCGEAPTKLNRIWGDFDSALEVHHIIPLKGEDRDFSALNLPWNLIGFCHDCHQEVHRVMRPLKSLPPTTFEMQVTRGQFVMAGLEK